MLKRCAAALLCAGLTINTMAAAAINAPASHVQVAGSAFNEAASSNLMSKPAIQKRSRASDSFSSYWLQSWFSTPSTTALTYGLLFDAGSTGTRLSIFAWPARIFPHAMPNVSEPISLVYFSDRRYPGIDQPAGRAFLSELLAEAEQYLAEYTESFNTFPLYLTATAGMRKLAPQQQAIAMQDVVNILSDSPFLFRPSWARIIAGEEEGVYGWLAANFALNTLFSNQTTGVQLSNTTVGALDLGGASTQITFVPPNGVSLLSGAFDVTVTPEIRTLVYTHSYLYYGANEAQRQLNEIVVAGALAAGFNVVAGAVIPHPCYLTGTPLFQTNYSSNSANGSVVYFSGTSDFATCMALATSLLLKNVPCLTDFLPVFNATFSSQTTNVPYTQSATDITVPYINPTLQGSSQSSCAVAGVYQPALSPPAGFSGQNVTFYAFSAFSYLWNFLRLPLQGPLRSLQSSVQSLCGLSYSAAVNAYGTADNAAYLPNTCILGAFQLALLTTGYGIPLDSVSVIVAPTNSTPVTYAYGAMLYFVNSLAWHIEAFDLTEQRDITIIALACVVAVLGAILLGVFMVRMRVCRLKTADDDDVADLEHSLLPPPRTSIQRLTH